MFRWLLSRALCVLCLLKRLNRCVLNSETTPKILIDMIQLIAARAQVESTQS